MGLRGELGGLPAGALPRLPGSGRGGGGTVLVHCVGCDARLRRCVAGGCGSRESSAWSSERQGGGVYASCYMLSHIQCTRTVKCRESVKSKKWNFILARRPAAARDTDSTSCVGLSRLCAASRLPPRLPTSPARLSPLRRAGPHGPLSTGCDTHHTCDASM